MKQLTALILLMAAAVYSLTVQAVNENAVLATWKRNAENTNGYKIYWGERSLSAKIIASADSIELYDYFMDVGQDTFCVIAWPDDVPIYAAVFAYNMSGFSEPSDEAAFAPLVFYDRYPQDDFLSPYDGYKINQYYGFTRNYYLYDSAYDWNNDGIIDPADKYYFKKHYYGRATK